MKKAKTIFCGLLAALIMTGAAAAKEMTAAEKQIVALEESVAKAFVAKDVKFLSGMMADDWMGQNESGRPLSKAQLLASVKSGDMAIAKIVNRDLHVRIVGNIAIVQGADDEKSKMKGLDVSGAYVWTDILEMRGGKWVMIAFQSTKVMAPPK